MYITKADLQGQGITGTDTYLDGLINIVESVFHTMIGFENLLEDERTEELENIYNVTEIFLKYPNPTELITINGDIITDYKILLQKLILKEAVSVSEDFPCLLTIIYTAGYTTTPDDVRQVLYSMASYFHNMKTSAGISSFSQDLLTVNFGAKEIYDYLTGIGENQIINKYKHYYAYSL